MDAQEIRILLLGDAEVGKSTFLSRPYRLEFYDTSSPTSYTLVKPSLIILCFSIPSIASLDSLKSKWKNIVETHFNYDESLPVLVLGLKRDLRRDGVEGMVFPQEALRVAAEMRCDRYCECSAVTGELCKEVWEDIVKTAIASTAEEGGRSEPPSCTLM